MVQQIHGFQVWYNRFNRLLDDRSRVQPQRYEQWFCCKERSKIWGNNNLSFAQKMLWHTLLWILIYLKRSLPNLHKNRWICKHILGLLQLYLLIHILLLLHLHKVFLLNWIEEWPKEVINKSFSLFCFLIYFKYEI